MPLNVNLEVEEELNMEDTILMVLSHEEETNVDFSVGDQCTENTSRECSFQLCIGNSSPLTCFPSIGYLQSNVE